MAQGKGAPRMKMKNSKRPNKKKQSKKKQQQNQKKAKRRKHDDKSKMINQHIENLMIARAKDASTAEGNEEESRRLLRCVKRERDVYDELVKAKKEGKGLGRAVPTAQTRKRRKRKEALKKKLAQEMHIRP